MLGYSSPVLVRRNGPVAPKGNAFGLIALSHLPRAFAEQGHKEKRDFLH